MPSEKCLSCVYLYTDDFCVWAEMRTEDVANSELCSYEPSGEVEETNAQKKRMVVRYPPYQWDVIAVSDRGRGA